MADTERNRPIFNSTTTARTTSAFIEWIRCQYGLRNSGRALDWIVDAILHERPIDASEFISGFTDDSGQVTEAFATVIVLFVGFIGIGALAFLASVAYIQPILRALGIH